MTHSTILSPSLECNRGQFFCRTREAGYMTEDSLTVECLQELQQANTTLQFLVCELLLKNQELRVQLATQRDCLEELHPR